MSTTEDELNRAMADFWLATGETKERAEQILGGHTDDYSRGIAHLAAIAERRYGRLDELEVGEYGRLRLEHFPHLWVIDAGFTWGVTCYRVTADEPVEYIHVTGERFDWFGQAFGWLAVDCMRAFNGEL